MLEYNYYCYNTLFHACVVTKPHNKHSEMLLNNHNVCVSCINNDIELNMIDPLT